MNRASSIVSFIVLAVSSWWSMSFAQDQDQAQAAQMMQQMMEEMNKHHMMRERPDEEQ